MKVAEKKGAAPVTRGPRGLASIVRFAVRSAWRVFVAWRWGAPLAKAAAAAVCLIVLAIIGRSAIAGAAPPLPAVPPPLALVSTAVAPVAPEVDASAPLAPSPAPPSSAHEAPSRRATPEDPVILNRAAFDDLRRLPGVGPKRAEAILALRERLGHFRQVEDLLKVKGIGRSTLKKLRPLVRLEPPP